MEHALPWLIDSAIVALVSAVFGPRVLGLERTGWRRRIALALGIFATVLVGMAVVAPLLLWLSELSRSALYGSGQ